jgi:hypothetical protein
MIQAKNSTTEFLPRHRSIAIWQRISVAARIHARIQPFTPQGSMTIFPSGKNIALHVVQSFSSKKNSALSAVESVKEPATCLNPFSWPC